MICIRPLHLPGFDPLQFLCKLRPDVREPALVRSGTWTILAWNPTERITWTTRHRWDELASVLRSRSVRTRSTLPFVGGLIGYLSYDLGYGLHDIRPTATDELGLPLLSLGVYDQALLWDGQRAVAVGDSAFCDDVRGIHMRPLPQTLIPPITLTPSMSRRDYAAMIAHTLRAIRDGEVYQLNATYMLRGSADCDHRQLMALLARTHPSPCLSYLETPESDLLSLSPEEFVTLRGRQLRTCPIKGTCPRGKTPAEDRRLRDALLASGKEAAELGMIVDLLRNDLGQIAATGSVKVLEHRRLQRLRSVWHTYSVIGAQLRPGLSAIDVLRSMLPGGSVTGCPKKRAMEYIDRLEAVRRGPYTGVTAMLSDDGSLASSVIIRTAIAKSRRFWVGVGGGIVHGSTVPREYDETLRKAAPFTALADGQEWFWIDGKRALSSDRRLANAVVEDPRSRGILDALVVDHGRIRFLADHLRRLRNSAALLGRPLPMDLRRIRTMLQKIARTCLWTEMRLRAVYTERHVLLRAIELVVDTAELTGAAVTVRPLTRRVPGVKLLPYHREDAVHESALARGFHEALITGRDGRVTEAAFSNVFWVERGVLWTPGERILPGITRTVVLRLARRKRLTVRFGFPTVDQLKRADEVFLTRSTVGVVPVIRIDQSRIAGGKPGKMTLRLQEAYQYEATKSVRNERGKR